MAGSKRPYKKGTASKFTKPKRKVESDDESPVRERASKKKKAAATSEDEEEVPEVTNPDAYKDKNGDTFINVCSHLPRLSSPTSTATIGLNQY